MPILAVAVVLAAATVLLLAAGGPEAPETPEADEPMPGIVLTLPETGEHVVLLVRTGRLPPQSELVLELADGAVLGSIAPFGQTGADAAEQAHSLVVAPPVRGEVRLRAVVVEAGARREARPGEVLGIEVLRD